MTDHRNTPGQKRRRLSAAAPPPSLTTRLGAGASTDPIPTPRVPVTPTPRVPETPTPRVPETSTPRRSRAWRAWIPAGVAAVIAVALAVTDLALAGHHQDGTSANELRQQLLSQAKTATAAAMSYDYRHLAADEKAAVALGTGEFVTNYTKAMTDSVKPNATKNKLVVTGEVLGAGIESVSSDGRTAVLLVSGRQNSTSATATTPQTQAVSLEATMVHRGQSWLLSKLTTQS